MYAATACDAITYVTYARLPSLIEFNEMQYPLDFFVCGSIKMDSSAKGPAWSDNKSQVRGNQTVQIASSDRPRHTHRKGCEQTCDPSVDQHGQSKLVWVQLEKTFIEIEICINLLL